MEGGVRFLGIMSLLEQLFTWWNSETIGTRFWTWRKGEFVGQDEFGNRYYRAPSKIPASIREHRWVIYKGYAEASAIPQGWHGWMHYRTDTPPAKGGYRPRDWEKPHEANPTGTAQAYRPPGSIVGPDRPRPVPTDYQAWTPE
jgi:NADH:ubiquinone oxidoreductase subunit